MKIVLFVLLLFPTLLQAHHKSADDILKELENAKNDSARVVLINSLSEGFFLTDNKKVREHALIAEQLATKLKFPAGKAQALNLIGYSYLIAGEYDQAFKYYHQALKLGEHIGETVVVAKGHLNLGVVYRDLKDPDRAIQHYQKSLEYARKTNDSLAISKVYNSLGNICEDAGSYQKALGLFRKAATIQEKVDDKRYLGISLHNIGYVHINLGQPEKGLPYLFQSLRIHDEINNDMIKIATLGSIAELYEATGRSREALKYAKQSYAMALKSASGKKIAASAKLLQKLYRARNDYEQAYKYLSVFQEYNEILNQESQKKVVAEVAIKYETHKKELENKTLKAESEKQELKLRHQQMKIISGGALLIVLLILTLLFYVNKQNLKIANQKLQEANNQMQLQNKEINRQKEEISAQSVMLRRQNEQLEKDNSFKNKVFSIISHDLRSPFISITGFINLLQVKPLTSDEIKPVFEIFGQEINLITNMINNLLFWSKAQLTGDKLNLELTDLYFQAENNIELVTAEANKKDIRIINDILDDSIILTDKERLNFIIRNLLVNAVKFTPKGGEIRLRVEEQSHTITLFVDDNGLGIPDKNFAKLFTGQRFSTLGTSKEKGTGLGLLLCKELMESLHGQIAVESTEGLGSSFSLIMPKMAAEALPEVKDVSMYA